MTIANDGRGRRRTPVDSRRRSARLLDEASKVEWLPGGQVCTTAARAARRSWHSTGPSACARTVLSIELITAMLLWLSRGDMAPKLAHHTSEIGPSHRVLKHLACLDIVYCVLFVIYWPPYLVNTLRSCLEIQSCRYRRRRSIRTARLIGIVRRHYEHVYSLVRRGLWIRCIKNYVRFDPSRGGPSVVGGSLSRGST